MDEVPADESETSPPASERGRTMRGPLGPYARTFGYYRKAWRRYLDDDEASGLPIVRPTPALAAGAFLDEVVLAGFRTIRPAGAPDLPQRAEHEIRRAAALYEESGWFDNPESFLAEPPELTKVTTRTVRGRRSGYEVATFPSEYEPYPDEPGRDRWFNYVANQKVHAWLLRHDEPRPWLVAVHGTGMGKVTLDMALFRARRLHDHFGLNVVMPVLPLHGPRGVGLPTGASYPSEDVIDAVHGTAQGVWDIRRVISWIRSQQGPGTPIGMSSISIGGFVAALVGSVTPGLTSVILGVPVADLVDLLDRHSGPIPSDQQWRSIELAKKVATVISPLRMTPKVPFQGRFIYAGLADRLVHPRHQVSRLWEHWGRPEISWYPSGHAGFFRSKAVQEFIEMALAQSGLIADEGNA